MLTMQEKSSHGESQELVRSRTQGKEDRQVRLVFFKTEDRKILACTLILLHLTKPSCCSTLINLLFSNYSDFKNELSLAMGPHDLFSILYCFPGWGGCKKSYPCYYCRILPMPVSWDFPKPHAASSTVT